MKRVSRLGLIFVSTAMGLFGQTPPTAATPSSVPSRLAVISDAGNKDLAALVTTELSSNPDITMLERDDLAKAGDELKLQQLAGSDAVALGKLVGADGLLFLNKGADGVQIRFTAVGLGYALFDDQIPSETDLSQLAKAIAHRVAGYAPKLKLDPTRAVPISVLNLRAEASGKDSETIERNLTLLLESRLASLPDCVVLERRHAWEMGFERSLTTPASLKLLQGAYILDGTLRMGATNDGGITALLRLRAPKSNQAISLQASGRIDDLPGVADAMVAEVNHAIGTTAPTSDWQSQAEAREYLQEGIWGWQNHELPLALEALDSASLLGETSAQLHTTRIQVLCAMAIHLDPQYNPVKGAPLPLEERIELLRRAMADLKAGGDGEGTIVLQALSLLEDLDLDPAYADQADTFRHEVCAMVNFDPLHGKAPDSLCFHADDVANSLEEEVAFYRIICSTQVHTLPSLDADSFCSRFLKTPAARQAAFNQFVQSLLADPKGKLYGLMLLSWDKNPAISDQAYPEFIKEMWNRREELKTGRINAYFILAKFFPEDLQKRHMKEAIPLLRYFLTQPDDPDCRYIEYLWKPQWFPPEDADAIWSDLLKRDPGAAAGDTTMAQQFLAVYPKKGIKAPEVEVKPDGPMLTVDKCWKPAPPAFPDGGFDILSPLTRSYDGKSFYVLIYQRGARIDLGIVHLPDLTTEVLDFGSHNCSVHAAPGAIYLFFYPGGVPAGVRSPRLLKRYDLDSQTWATRELNEDACDIFTLNDQIYLNLRNSDLRIGVGASQFLHGNYDERDEAGLARYDWDQDKVTILASSRRVPPQNQFDDRPAYPIFDLFPGLGNQPCIQTDEGAFYVQEKPGPWPRAFDFTSHIWPTPQGRQTLLAFQKGEIVLLDPDKPKPIALLAPVDSIEDKNPQLAKNKPSPWAAEALWKFPPRTFADYTSAGYHDRNLYMASLAYGPRKFCQLLCFLPGRAKPITIPLEFLPGPSENAPINKMSAFDCGLCFHSERGVWFLPYSDIDAYVKSNARLVHAP